MIIVNFHTTVCLENSALLQSESQSMKIKHNMIVALELLLYLSKVESNGRQDLDAFCLKDINNTAQQT